LIEPGLIRIVDSLPGYAVPVDVTCVCNEYAWSPGSFDCSSRNLKEFPDCVRGAIKIDASNNPFGQLTGSTLAHMPNLREIKFDGCDISFVDSTAFVGTDSLEVLSLWNNPLSSFDDIILPSTLTSLVLGGTNLEAVPVIFSDSLQSLDLSSTRISVLYERAFAGTPNILYLWLNNNALTAINQLAFRGLTKLVSLWINNCQINELHAQWFLDTSSLQVLIASYNNIEDIDRHTFNALSQLKLTKLQLKNNNLTSLHSDEFALITTLTSLNLDNNPIAAIGTGATTQRMLSVSLCGNTALQTHIAHDAFLYATIFCGPAVSGDTCTTPCSQCKPPNLSQQSRCWLFLFLLFLVVA
jgi:Leucine-rich repeat (LRR) protein